MSSRSRDAYKYTFNKSLENTGNFIKSQIDDEATYQAVFNILQGKLKNNRDSAIEKVMKSLEPEEDRMNSRNSKPVMLEENPWRPACHAADLLENVVKNCIEIGNGDENLDPKRNEQHSFSKKLQERL